MSPPRRPPHGRRNVPVRDLTAVEALRAARELLLDPARWCKSAGARKRPSRDFPEGEPVPATAASAVRWCAGGALCHLTGKRTGPPGARFLDHAAWELFGVGIGRLNDRPETTGPRPGTRTGGVGGSNVTVLKQAPHCAGLPETMRHMAEPGLMGRPAGGDALETPGRAGCPACGVGFTVRRRWQRYCSPRCRQRAYRDRQRSERHDDHLPGRPRG
jgi:hypothetical protein